MTDKLLSLIGALYPLRALDAGEFARLKVHGLRFTIEAYEADGLGHVSVMRAGGMLGLMKMDTLIVNPTRRDLPLYSYDRIHAMGNDTLIIELYDTTLEAFSCEALNRLQAEARGLPDRDPGTHWYDGIRLPQSLSKKGKRAQSPAFDRLAADFLTAWLHAECPPTGDFAAKREKTAAYVNGLLAQGGPSTDVFRKALGTERTAALFRNVLFGIS